MTCFTVMKLPESGTITHLNASSNEALNVDLITDASTSTTLVNDITTSAGQDKRPSLDRVILLQASELPSDFSAFVDLLPSLVKERFSELLTVAKHFNPRATGALIRELCKQKKCDSVLLSFYWNNYTPDLPYARALRWWTFTHAVFPPSIVKHLDTFDKGTTSFTRFCDAIWFQRNLFPEDVKHKFFDFYWKFLIESNRFSDARWALLEGEEFLPPLEFAVHFKELDGKEFIEKDSDWVALFKQKFPEALNAKQYVTAAYALMQIKRFLRVEDGHYFPALVLTFLEVLRQEEDKVLREEALLQFDLLFTSEEDMYLWTVQPYLFTEGVILYLEMTNTSVESGIIKEICHLQSDLSHPNRDRWTLLLFKYLSRQSHWPQASLLYIKECFSRNPNFLSNYFSHNEDPEFLLNLSVLCLQNKIGDACVEKCFEDKFRSILIQRYPEKTRAFIQLYIGKNSLQGSSKVEPILKMIVLQGTSKEQFSLNKPILEKLLEVKKIVFQNSPSMAEGYAELFDILLENDSSMCMSLLKLLDKINNKNITECYKKYFKALLDGGRLEDAFVFCDMFRNNVNEQEIIPYIQKEQLSAPSPTLGKFILKYMTSFSDEQWIRFSLHLYKTNQSDIVIDYFRHTLACLKKMKAGPSKALSGEELSTVFALLKLCVGKNLDSKLQQELCLFIPELIVQYPLKDKSDQIALLNYFQVYALNHSEKRFLEAFRRQAKCLLGYNALQRGAKTGEALFPEYNDLQEVNKMASLDFPKEFQLLFNRVYYYLDRIEKSKNEVSLQAAEGISAVISEMLTRDLDKRKEELQSIFVVLLNKDVELLKKIDLYHWLETLLYSPYKNASHFFQRILDLTLKCNSKEDVHFVLSTKLLEYMTLEKVIWNDNIKELLNASSLSIENRAAFLHQILSYGCSHVLRLEIQYREDSLFLGAEDTNGYLASSLKATTECMHLLEKPESFLPLLKQLHEGIAFILSREADKSKPSIESEKSEKYRLMMSFLKKLLHIKLDATVKTHIIKSFLYAFAHQEDIAHRVTPEENRKLLIEVVKVLSLNSLGRDLRDELMSFLIQIEYRGLLLTDLVYKSEREPIWKERAKEAILSDAKYYSKIILEKIDANSFENLSPYIDCLKLGVFKNLMHLDKETLRTYIDIFKGFLKHIRMKSDELPTLVEHEFLELYSKLYYPIEDKLVSSANNWETLDKESFFTFLILLTRAMQLVARNTLTGTFHISCKRLVGYVIEIKNSSQLLVDNDLKKRLEEVSVLADYLSFCHKMLKKSLRTKKHEICELYIKIFEELFEKIKDSNPYKNVFELEKDAIYEVMNPFLKTNFGTYESRLLEVKSSYKQLAFLPLEIMEEEISVGEETLPICKDLADDLNALLNSDSPLSKENLKQFENILEDKQTDLIERIVWDKLVVNLFKGPSEDGILFLLKIFNFFKKDRPKTLTFLKSILNELLKLPVLHEEFFETLLSISYKFKLPLEVISEIFQPVFIEYFKRTIVETRVSFEVILHKSLSVTYKSDYILRTPVFFAKNINLISIMKEGSLLIPHIIYMQLELISNYPFEKFKEVHTSVENHLKSSNITFESTPAIVTYWKNTLENLLAAWKEMPWDHNYETVLLDVHKKLLMIIKEKKLQREFVNILNITMSFALTPLKDGFNINKKLMQQFETVFSADANYLKLITHKMKSVPKRGYYHFNEEFEGHCVTLTKQIASIQSITQTKSVVESLESINEKLMVCEPLEMPNKVLNAYRLIKEIMKVKDEILKESLFFSEGSLGLAETILNHFEIHSANLSRETIGEAYPYFLNAVVGIIYEYSTYCSSFKLENWIAHHRIHEHVSLMTTLHNCKRLLRDLIHELPEQTVQKEIQGENIYLEYINFLENIFMCHQNNETYREIIKKLENVNRQMSISLKNPKEKKWVLQQIVVLKPILQHWIEEVSSREMPEVLRGEFGLTLLLFMF